MLQLETKVALPYAMREIIVKFARNYNMSIIINKITMCTNEVIINITSRVDRDEQSTIMIISYIIFYCDIEQSSDRQRFQQ